MALSKEASSLFTNTNLDEVVFVARSKSNIFSFSPNSKCVFGLKSNSLISP